MKKKGLSTTNATRGGKGDSEAQNFELLFTFDFPFSPFCTHKKQKQS